MEQQPLFRTPVLEPIFLVVHSITTFLQNVESSKEELSVIMAYIYDHLQSLDAEYQSGRLTAEGTSEAIDSLSNLVIRMAGFVEKEASKSFFRSVLSKGNRLAALMKYEAEVENVVGLFQSIYLPRPENLWALVSQARQSDQTILCARLTELESNGIFFTETLNLTREKQLGLIVALQNLANRNCGDEERRFFSRCIQYLQSATGAEIELKNWTITIDEIELGSVIGSGIFGQVHRGTLEGIPVALKVMKNGSITPQISVIRPIIGRWLELNHEHVLKFVGANLSNDYPFFVTPYLKNSNVMNYTRDQPGCDFFRILHQVSLGVAYLHSQDIVHGSIKGTNILIDNEGRALLSDYGLDPIKADFNSRLSGNDDLYGAYQNWMAPELFTGAPLDKACDLYSFGMTIYEIFTGQRPFGNIPRDSLRTFVVQGSRPTRPSREQAPQLSNEIWTLVQQCWHQVPAQRPYSSVLSAHLALLQPTPSVPPHSRSQSQSQSYPSAYVDGAASQRTSRSYLARARSSFFSISQNSGGLGVNSGQPSPTPMIDPVITPPLIPEATHLSNTYAKCLTLRAGSPSTGFSPVIGAVMYPKGDKAVTAQQSGTITIWDAIEGLTLYTFDSQQTTACLTMQPFNRIIAGSSSGVITVWAFKGKKAYRTNFTPGGANPIQCTESPTREIIYSFSLSSDLTTGTCNIQESKALPPKGFREHSSKVVAGMFSIPTCSAFLPQRKYLLTGDAEGTLSVWERKTGQQARKPLPYNRPSSRSHTLARNVASAPPPQSGGCISIVPSPDGSKVLVAYSTTEIRLWDTSSWTYTVIQPPPFNPTSERCNSLPLAFSPDGSWVLYPSLSEPKTIQVYDLTSNIVITTCTLDEWPDGAAVHTIILTPDKKRLLLAFDGIDKALIFCWPVPPKPNWFSKLF